MQLVEYEEYVVNNNLADLKKVAFYSRWVKRFLGMNFSDKLSNIEKVTQFIEALAVEPNLDEWHERQARDAVEIYLNLFLEYVRSKESDSDPEASGYIDELKKALRLKHKSIHTEKAYVDWSGRYLKYCREMGYDPNESSSVKLYLTYLAVKRNVAGATQDQAFNSLLSFFRNVFGYDLDNLKGTVRSRKKINIPAVLSVNEVKRLLKQVEGLKRYMLELTYGTGMTDCS